MNFQFVLFGFLARLLPALAGALVFIVFAQGLEGALHYLALYREHAFSRAIGANPWLYMLYGALAAGVFEETGRYVAFRRLIGRKRYPERDAAVTYGVGHGGIESILLALALLAERPERLTPGYCLLVMLERTAAIGLHVALSCFVFLAARDGTKRLWFPFAIALHAIVDMPAALYQRGMLPLWAVELWLCVAALYALRSARKRYLEEMDP